MFTVELYAAVRRAVMFDGLSHREAARRFGVHRNTISKMLQFSVPPGYRRRERSVSTMPGMRHDVLEGVRLLGSTDGLLDFLCQPNIICLDHAT